MTNPSTTGRDDSQPTLDRLWAEIESRFGICPSFFKLAHHEPLIAWRLFRMAEFAYLDNPLPALFKGKLFMWLSRFCEVRYCVARYCTFLLGQGVSAEQALALLNEPMPDKECQSGSEATLLPHPPPKNGAGLFQGTPLKPLSTPL